MATQSIIIDNILSGLSDSDYFAKKGSYTDGYGIDIDFPVTDGATDKKPSGYIRPTALAKFTGSAITGAPMWIETNPKTETTYVYDTGGIVYTMSSALTSASSFATLATASGNGMAYFDNYIYCSKNADIARIGPLNGAPATTTNYWTGTLALAALTNTTYPTLRGVQIPNHPMHRHTDGKLYIGDVLSNTTVNTNKGALHYIRTSKTTVEGDTNNGSSYNALDLGYGYYPTCIESWNTDLVVAGIEGVGTTIQEQRGFITFWDTTSSSFQKLIQVEFPDPLITAMKNVNGILYVWSGSAQGGCRLSRLVGNYTFEEIFYDNDSLPPFQGAVDHTMGRIVWGHFMVDPESVVDVMAHGSKISGFSNGPHSILKTTSAGTNGNVTSLKYVQQGSTTKSPIVGWKDDSSQGIDKLTTTYATSLWRSAVYKIGKPFVIKKIEIPLGQAVGANMTVTPKIFVDEFTNSQTLTIINSTNYPNQEKNIVQYPNTSGSHSFSLELKFTGAALCAVGFPINITVETKEQ